MYALKLSADDLVQSLLNISESEHVCLLDSSAINHHESHLLVAGIKPIEVVEISNSDPAKTLDFFNEKLQNPDTACIFTVSYDFGMKLEKISPRAKEFESFPEPDIYVAVFDCVIVHDYDSGESFLTGNSARFSEFETALNAKFSTPKQVFETSSVSSNFNSKEYIKTVETIQEYIRAGHTYQANLTQQLRAKLPANMSAQAIFWNLRTKHPAPFSAFLKRNNDFVVSISPERLIKFDRDSNIITASPIKGTRKRGSNPAEDERLKRDLLASEKDRSENVMIVDLLRNDIGRICEFGSVEVEKLCDLETHPTLFHLVSTIKGSARPDITSADIIRAIFPCGSITGAPKIRTMQIIDELETANRGLSMGAIGYHIPKNGFDLSGVLDLNVAIRTMVVRENEAIFNVGGGIVIDSDPLSEYDESMLKAKALLSSLNARLK